MPSTIKPLPHNSIPNNGIAIIFKIPNTMSTIPPIIQAIPLTPKPINNPTIVAIIAKATLKVDTIIGNPIGIAKMQSKTSNAIRVLLL